MIAIYVYLFYAQSIHIDKSYINSNKITHRIKDKYIIMHMYKCTLYYLIEFEEIINRQEIMCIAVKLIV